MFLDHLFEMASARLYHSTNYYSAVQIIRENVFLAKTEHDFPNGPAKGVSFTRNRYFAKHWSWVAFELDRDRLAQRYRLIPHNYWHRGTERSQGDARVEAEEFVIGPVANASRYITAIYMTRRSFINLEKLHGPSEGFYDPLSKHPLLKIQSP